MKQISKTMQQQAVARAIHHIETAIEELSDMGAQTIGSQSATYYHFRRELEKILSQDHGEAGLVSFAKKFLGVA